MKAVFLNVEENKAPEIIDYVDELDFLQKTIKCSLIDIVRRQICGEYYHIICDDEGALKKYPKISSISKYLTCQFFGNLIIVGEGDEEGNLHGFSEVKANYLVKNAFLFLKVDNQLRHVLICE